MSILDNLLCSQILKKKIEPERVWGGVAVATSSSHHHLSLCLPSQDPTVLTVLPNSL